MFSVLTYNDGLVLSGRLVAFELIVGADSTVIGDKLRFHNIYCECS